MKRKLLDLGQSDFKNTITGNNYYVDKSLLIEELITAEKSVLLFPRPRRFGKTLNLSMLRYFFDKNELSNQNLFEKLKIWESDENIKQHYRKYPVIYLTFKDAKGITWQDCRELIKAEIVEAYQQHRYLLENNFLFDDEKNAFNAILNKTAKNTDFERSLKNLSAYLQRFHKEKVVILIDEYDAPIQSAYGKFYEEAVWFMRTLLSAAFKGNSTLYKGIITGILRISKESIFSGLNNLSVHSVVNNRFSDKFGFTEEEVAQILTDFELSDKNQKIKAWYNGYTFGQSENIYNPWSILTYVTEHKDGFRTFWTNTSSDTLIKRFLQKKEANKIREQLLKLINNETIEKEIAENFSFPDLDADKEFLWTLLVYSGYLTTRKQISRKKYELAIPNFEIKTMFQDTIMQWLRVDIKIQKTLLEQTANHLISNQLVNFEIGFKQIIGDTFSYFDTEKSHEYIYHSYILGLLAIIGDAYIIKSNKESGEGRYDILLIPHDKSKNGVVIEIKQIEKQKKKEIKTKFNKRINTEIKNALAQIDKNKYFKELIANKITESNIIKVAIIFAGKEPYMLPI